MEDRAGLMVQVGIFGVYETHEAWPVGHQVSYSITLHPTEPESPVLTAVNEGNQIVLSWATPCDGGKDITRHEYRQKTRSGTFGSWITPSPTVVRVA